MTKVKRLNHKIIAFVLTGVILVGAIVSVSMLAFRQQRVINETQRANALESEQLAQQLVTQEKLEESDHEASELSAAEAKWVQLDADAKAKGQAGLKESVDCVGYTAIGSLDRKQCDIDMEYYSADAEYLLYSADVTKLDDCSTIFIPNGKIFDPKGNQISGDDQGFNDCVGLIKDDLLTKYSVTKKLDDTTDTDSAACPACTRKWPDHTFGDLSAYGIDLNSAVLLPS